MSDVTTLAAALRERAGKGAARATRREGKIPGVIYGAKQPPVMISMEPRKLFAEMLKAGFRSRMFELDLGANGKHRVMARDVQMHPVTDMPVHVDFLRVAADSVVHVAVPVHFINEDKSPGLKRGGVLNVVRHDIEVTCAADSVPDTIVIDLAGLEIGDSVHISAIGLPEGVTPSVHRDFTIISIAAPTVAAGGEGGQA